jgi:hypothetical protein
VRLARCARWLRRLPTCACAAKMNDPTTLFTRGAPGDADTRGESMVSKHLARQKAASEADALAALARALPGTSESLLRTSLEACAWDADAAAAQLREFLASTGGAAKRAAPEGGRGGGGGSSSSGSSSGSSDDDSSDDSDGGAKRKRHGKERDKKSKRSKTEKREKHKKKSKRSKKERKEPAARGAIGADQFGKYGIVKETDQWEKQPEFNSWVTEVKKRNPETLQKWEERDMFKARVHGGRALPRGWRHACAASRAHRLASAQEFMEDYNTATMPHKKFYSLERWHAKLAARAAKHGGVAEGVRVCAVCLRRFLPAHVQRARAAMHARAERGSGGSVACRALCRAFVIVLLCPGAHRLCQPGGGAQARAGCRARPLQGARGGWRMGALRAMRAACLRATGLTPCDTVHRAGGWQQGGAAGAHAHGGQAGRPEGAADAAEADAAGGAARRQREGAAAAGQARAGRPAQVSRLQELWCAPAATKVARAATRNSHARA